MTLTAVEAEEIVDGCIRSAVGWDGLISGSNTLGQVGVKDDDAIDALIDEIVTNGSVGVPSKGHEIDPEALSLETGTTVSETQDQVIENSSSAQPSLALAAKARAKSRLTRAASAKSSAQDGSSSKGAKKKDKKRGELKAGKRSGKKSGRTKR